MNTPRRRPTIAATTRWRRRLLASAALWMLLVVTAHAASVSVRAFLDRDHAQLGDTVTLNVQINGSADADMPDVSALAPDFDIVRTYHNTSISIDNGQRSVTTLWAVQLQPKHVGTLRIPPLQVDGYSTASLSLVVSAAPATAQGGPGDPVFIEVTPDTRTPYVGQQVNLDVSLFYAPNLNDGSIDKPQADGLEVRQIGSSARYQTERGGRRYHVVEQHYALIAQHAGTIDLPPLVFRGSMLDVGDFSGFFGGGKPVQARSPAIDFAVRTRPSSERHGPWLPARQVTLALTGLPADGHVQVGEPLTLTLQEKAVGLPFESLPTPSLPKLQGVEVYPDQPQGKTGNDGHWLHGQRTRKFALVPQQTGRLTIPAITLRWWNLGKDHAEEARIPAHTLTVVAATGATATTGAVVGSGNTGAAPVAAAQPTTGSSPAVVISASGGGYWRILAVIGLGLWLLTLIGIGSVWWWRRRRRLASPPAAAAPTAGRRLRNAFLHAVRSGDAAAQAEALLAWAQAERAHLHNLGELGAALQSPEQRAEIAALQRARYSVGAQAPDRDALAAAFAKGFQWRHAVAAQASPLPPLYPT